MTGTVNITICTFTKRTRKDYWRQLGNHKWQLFYLISKQVGGSKSVCAFYRFDALVQLMNKISFLKV